MELGGNNALIVCADAEPERAARSCTPAGNGAAAS
jgi:acyl-CoA reductase-like NAD-dependent aldehyde dehydrogenase